MKVPNSDKLAKIKIQKPIIIPTFEDKTNGKTIVIEMADKTIAQYYNEGYLKLMGKHISKEEAIKQWVRGGTMDDFNQMYKKSSTLLKYVKEIYPNVINVYLGEL